MKRLFLLSVLVVLAFAVTGCNNSPTDDGTQNNGPRSSCGDCVVDYAGGVVLSYGDGIVDSNSTESDSGVSGNGGEPSNLEGTSWRLSKVTIGIDFEPLDTINYYGQNIIYEFKGNNKLVITGKTDSLFIFDNFQEGEHYYEYWERPVNPACVLGPNLSINNPPDLSGQWEYYANIVDDTLSIGRQETVGWEDGGNGLRVGGIAYRWGKYLIRSKGATGILRYNRE